MATFRVKGSLVAGALAAIGASVCCVGPLVLLALGIGGAWIANLTALEPLRPWFAYSARSRTPFRCDGGQHSAVMADSVPR